MFSEFFQVSDIMNMACFPTVFNLHVALFKNINSYGRRATCKIHRIFKVEVPFIFESFRNREVKSRDL